MRPSMVLINDWKERLVRSLLASKGKDSGRTAGYG